MKGPTRGEFLGALGSAAVTLLGLNAPAPAVDTRNRPNLILVLPDDQS
ncbi:MAG: hypothetical protein WB819_14620 [Terriglobia bacterium]|jgi:hypothetical protein